MRPTRMTAKELKEVEEEVQQVAAKFPEIIWIRHAFRDDWDGDPAIYFQVLLKDETTADFEQYRALTRRIEDTTETDLGIWDTEYLPYFRFRTKSAQERLKDPQWE